MTVDITQEEMNILNLNGISANDVQDNILYMRATGLDDETIRQEYSNTIAELRPITKQSYNDTAKIKQYEEKGGITPFEYGQREAFEFDGTYDNIIQHPEYKNKRAEENKKKIEERNKRVNEGTGSFLDRAGAALDRWSEKYMAEPDFSPVTNDFTRLRAGIDEEGNYDHHDTSKPIGAAEGYANSFMTGAWIPFAGGYIKGIDDKKEREIEEKIRNGEPIRQDELNFINHRIDKRQEEAARGYTIGGKIAEGLLPSMIRFTGEIATGTWVLKGLGLAGAGGSVGKGAYDLLRTTGASKNVSLVGGKIAKGVTQMGMGGAVNTLLPTGWDSTFEAYQERRLNKSFELTDKGTALFKEAQEKPATAFMKSLGSTFVMYASEYSGGLVNIPVKGISSAATKYVGTPISAYIKSQPQLVKFADKVMPELSKLYEKVNGFLPKGKNYEFLKDMTKFDGFIEEMGEEVIEDLLNITLGTGDEERTLENYAKAVFKSPDEWAVLAGAIALQGGFLSVASHNLGSFMEQNGASDEEIIEALQNLTEREKEQKFSELSQDGIVNIKEYVNEDRQRRNELKNSFYTQNLNAGVDKEEALHSATIESESIANLANTIGMDINELQNEFGISVKNLDDEQAQRVLNGEVIEEEEYEGGNDAEPLFQTMHKDDRFNSLKDFVQSVQENINSHKNEKRQIGNLKLSVPADVVQHDKKHILSPDEWQEIENNIDNIFIAKKTEDKNSFSDNNYKVGIKTKDGNYYGLVIGINKHDNLICTAFKNTKNGVEAFVEERGKKDKKKSLSVMPTSQPSAPVDNAVNSVATHSQGSNNIINYIKENLNPNVNKHEDDIYFQRKRINPAEGQLSLFDSMMQVKAEQEEKIFQPENESGQNVQTEIKQTYDTTDVQKETEIKDTGDSLLGNLKKNKKQYTWEELDKMNDLLRKKYVSKSYIYQLPTVEELRKDELSDKAIAFIYLIHSKINAKPSSNYNDSKEIQKMYFDGVHEVMEKTIKFAKENNDFLANFDKHSGRNDQLFKEVFPDKDNKKPYNIFWAYPEYNKKAIVVGGNKLIGAMQLGYSSVADIENFLKLVNTEKDDSSAENKKETLTGWRTMFDVVEGYRGWCVADRKSHLIITSKDLPTKEVAEQYAQLIYEHAKEASQSYTDDYADLRNYIPRRENNQNVRPEALIEVFGFRGINFGNWTKQQERQDFINLAYDSLYDLAELLNLPPQALSLGGKLGLAFGAQGRSKAAGHFIPEYNEINMTRKSGAGTLAHEWWHALDYYFGDQSKNKDFSGIPSLSLKDQGALREEVFNALQNLKEQIMYSPLTQKDIDEKSTNMEKGVRRNLEYYANDIKNTFKKSKNAEKIAKLVDDILSNVDKIDFQTEEDNLNKQFFDLLEERRKTFENLGKFGHVIYLCKKLHNVKDIAKASKKYSKFYENAKLLNELEKGMGKTYWTSNTELGARAFSSYILNKIAEQNYKNNFLARDEKGEVSLNLPLLGRMIEAEQKGEKFETDESLSIEWYPAEPEERKRIFSAFDKLFSTVQTKQEDNKIILYQENEDLSDKRGFTLSRENFDGTMKDNLIVLLKNKTDKSTLLHEFAHVYLITLNRLAMRNDKARELLTTVNKWLNYNGKEYTRKQHEKFANGFVAYVKAGKAPTYGLKRAFENFKQWLKDTFVSLEYNDGVEIDEDTRKVFNELLGNLSSEQSQNRIQEIIRKARDNANLRILEEDENRNVPINQLTDVQRRYRDTAYDILWYALSNTKNEEGRQLVKDKRQLYMLLGNDAKMNKKNKGVMKQGEKLAEILYELDDVFTGGNGVQPEWREFFAVPEDSDDYDADLATQAYNVISDRKYLRAYDEVERMNELIAKDIDASKYELEYILDLYKNEKNKDDIVAAFFTWVDGVHPYIQEDIIKEWELKTNEIDRYESLNKFQKAKEDLKLYAAKLKGYGDYSTQFAEYARQILKRLDFMTEQDKAKMLNVLKDYNSFSEIERNLDFVMDYAQTLDDISYRRNLADTIVNEIKTTIPEKVNGTKKTKYDYRTNKLFERLRYLNKLSQEEASDLYDGYVNEELDRRAYAQKEDGTINSKEESYFEDIENSFLQFKANGMYYNSTEMLETLLYKIQDAKYQGKLSRNDIDFEKRVEQRNWIDACAVALETHRGKVGKLEELYSLEANFSSILDMMFDENVKEKFSLDDFYARVDGRVGKDRQEVLDKIAEVFGFTGALKGAKLNNLFIEMAGDRNYTIKQRYAQKEDTDSLGVWNWEPITLSRMEILYYYIQAKNPVSYQMLTDMGDETRPAKGQFDRDEFNELLTNLSDQEKLMGDILQIAAEKYYNELNRYHINKHHIDMGKVTCYFPRKSEMTEVNELDLFNTYTEKSTNPKFVKMRTAGPSIRIAPANPVNVLFSHIQKANTIIIMGEQLDLINKVFRDNDLKQKINSVFGETAYKEFMQHVTENLYAGQTKTQSTAEGAISKLMSNIIGAPIMIKPQIALKQMMSLINYGVGDKYVSTGEWIKEFGNVIKNPKAAIEFMLEDEYLKDRVSRGNLNEALKNQLENAAGAKLGILSEFFSLNMRMGDIAAIAFGGRAYVSVLMKKGYTREQAFEIFRKKTVNDQQSSINSTLSNLQRNSKNNPFAKLLFAYQNTPHQYFRTCANAVIKAKQGKISKKQAAKTIIIYWYLFPLMFNMATSLSPLTFLATGDPEELYTDLTISLLGNISCLPFFGEMARAVWSTITGNQYLGKRDWFSRANQAIVQPIKKIQKDELTFSDIIKSLEVFAQGVGIPLEEIDTQIEAIGDYAQGDFLKGAVKTLGYSRARADVVSGEK